MNWVEILVGLGLLAFGRKLFWVFVGGAGFAAGILLVQAFFPEQPQSTVLIAGAVGAVAGIALAKLVKTVAVAVGGFLGGGVIGLGLARMIGPPVPEWLGFIVLGILGVVIVKTAFDVAIVLLPAIAGAFLIVRNLPLTESHQAIAVVVLSVVGILVQRSLQKGGSSEKKK